ncbi:MAG TPA: methionyl-tRNA formyltransferase [Gaiellaceae bacterium]|nr:methionyl-tRNA formyltransferase [Gaiellaceae bacterium]
MTRLGVAATAPFGADVLERLARDQDVAWVLTRPDRPAGRGRKTTPPPAKIAAERLGLEVRQPEKPTPEDIAGVDTIVLVAYGVLIPDELLERALWLNVHPSLLPRWRGAAPVERAILAGDEETGVSIIKLVKELDAGPIAGQRAFPIAPEDDAGAVYARAADVSGDLLADVLPSPTFREQEGEVTYAEKLTAADRELDLSRPDDALRRIRALSPHIGARAELHGRPVTIWRARIEDGELVPTEVQPDGGRRMTYDAFLRGLR